MIETHKSVEGCCALSNCCFDGTATETMDIVSDDKSKGFESTCYKSYIDQTIVEPCLYIQHNIFSINTHLKIVMASHTLFYEFSTY